MTAVNIELDLSSASKCQIAGFNGTTIDSDASSTSNLKIYDIVAKSVKAHATCGANIKLQGECGNAFIDKSVCKHEGCHCMEA